MEKINILNPCTEWEYKKQTPKVQAQVIKNKLPNFCTQFTMLYISNSNMNQCIHSFPQNSMSYSFLDFAQWLPWASQVVLVLDTHSTTNTFLAFCFLGKLNFHLFLVWTRCLKTKIPPCPSCCCKLSTYNDMFIARSSSSWSSFSTSLKEILKSMTPYMIDFVVILEIIWLKALSCNGWITKDK